MQKKIEDISKNMPFTEYGNPAIIEERPDKFPKNYNSFRIDDGSSILLNKTISIPDSGTYTIIFWIKSYKKGSGGYKFIYTPQSYNFPIIGLTQPDYTGFVFEFDANYPSSIYIDGDNIWHQLCLTKDSYGVVRYFVDGSLAVSTSGRNYAQSIDMNIDGYNKYRQCYFYCANAFMTTDLLYTENFTPETSFLFSHEYLYSNLKIE